MGTSQTPLCSDKRSLPSPTPHQLQVFSKAKARRKDALKGICPEKRSWGPWAVRLFVFPAFPFKVCMILCLPHTLSRLGRGEAEALKGT